MGKRKVIFFCLGVAFVLTAVVWAISREREPSYQGRTLSEWTDLLPGKNDDASNAIRHVGSNSLPVILKWLRYEPPSWKVKMVRPLGAVPDWVRPRFLVRWLVDKPAQARVGRSYRVLSILQEGAAPIAPELLRLSYDKSDVVPNRALQALGSMGTTSPPV